MNSTQITLLPVPDILKNEVECVRMVEQSGEEGVAINVTPGGVPGLVFQQNNGRAAIEHITTHAGRQSCVPPLFLYGPGMEPSTMQYQGGVSTTIQVVFKPHALKTLLGINASTLTDGWTDLQEFSAEDLEGRLLEAQNQQERLMVLLSFLGTRVKLEHPRDREVEESLRLIHQHLGSIHVKDLLAALHLSERQFERRFIQTVGLSPHAFIRVQRFQEAIRLIKTRQFQRLTDVAAALNFADQAHFIRDFKAFSGMTPSSLLHQEEDVHGDQAGFAYV